MTPTDRSILAFAAFGLASQAVLVAFFAARRWAPVLAERFGWVAYAFAGLGLPLGGWLFSEGESSRIWMGPLLLALWAAYGAYLDLWRRVEWRVPVVWRYLVPFVALYFFAQMYLWWPLWDYARTAWVAFAVLFVANTALNLRGHFKAEP